MTKKFPIKGFDEGVLISVYDGDWDQIQKDLLAQIDTQLSFFSKSKVAIEVGEKELGAAQLSKLRDKLLDRDIKLFAVLSTSKKTETNASTLGLSTRSSIMQKKDSPFSAAIMNGEPALYIPKTLRSGKVVEYDGHIIIYGDVNPGAKVIAMGSVFVWGKLRGTVYAGMAQNPESIVCALICDPISLRIDNIPLKNNKLLRKLRKKPARVHIENNELVLDYWD